MIPLLLFGGWRAHVRSAPFRAPYAYEVFLLHDAGGKTHLMQNDGSMTEIPEGATLNPEPTFELSRDMLQALADALANEGITPDKRRHIQEMDLIKYHLEDMRRLVFKKDGGTTDEV